MPFFKKKPAIYALTFYARDSGVVAYEVHLQDRFGTKEAFVRKFLCPGLAWAWRSEWPKEPTLRQRRDWTVLANDNLTDLVADFSETDLNDYGRSIVLLGFLREEQALISTATTLRDSLNRFDAGNESPVRIVVIQADGWDPEIVFVPQLPTEPVKEFLLAMQISSDHITSKRKYKQLHTAQLENVIDYLANFSL